MSGAMNLDHVLFEGRQLDVRSLGRVFRRGSTVVAEIDDRCLVLHVYDTVDDAELGKNCLLQKLNRRCKWI